MCIKNHKKLKRGITEAPGHKGREKIQQQGMERPLVANHIKLKRSGFRKQLREGERVGFVSSTGRTGERMRFANGGFKYLRQKNYGKDKRKKPDPAKCAPTKVPKNLCFELKVTTWGQIAVALGRKGRNRGEGSGGKSNPLGLVKKKSTTKNLLPSARGGKIKRHRHGVRGGSKPKRNRKGWGEIKIITYRRALGACAPKKEGGSL